MLGRSALPNNYKFPEPGFFKTSKDAEIKNFIESLFSEGILTTDLVKDAEQLIKFGKVISLKFGISLAIASYKILENSEV